MNDNKTLKLTNVLCYKIPLDDEDINIDMSIQKMQSYIKVKGAVQIGPLIQYTRTIMNENNEIDMELIMMLQYSDFIHNVANQNFRGLSKIVSNEL